MRRFSFASKLISTFPPHPPSVGRGACEFTAWAFFVWRTRESGVQARQLLFLSQPPLIPLPWKGELRCRNIRKAFFRLGLSSTQSPNPLPVGKGAALSGDPLTRKSRRPLTCPADYCRTTLRPPRIRNNAQPPRPCLKTISTTTPPPSRNSGCRFFNQHPANNSVAD